MFDTSYRHTLYQDEECQTHPVTFCPFFLEELPACWPAPQLPPPLATDAELFEALRSSSGDVVQINEYRAFNGEWYLVHCENVQKHDGFGNVILFPPYAAKLAESEAFIKAAIANAPQE